MVRHVVRRIDRWQAVLLLAVAALALVAVPLRGGLEASGGPPLGPSGPQQPQPAAPAAPSDLTATATSTSITLSWPAVTGASSYDVKLGTTETAVPSGTSYTFPNLTPGTAYTLSVRAKNNGGESGWSHIPKATILAAPAGLNVLLLEGDGTESTQGTLSLRLNWGEVPGATSYDVKRSPGSETPTTVTVTSHTFTGLTAGTEYTFYARAKYSAGNSAWSSIGATTAQRGAPSGLSVYPSSDNLTLYWAPVTGVESYEVKRGAGGAVTTVWGTNANRSVSGYRFRGLAANTEYTLYVRASYGSGSYSEWSSITATTGTTAAAIPEYHLAQSFSVTATRTSLTLSWTPTRQYAQYQVKRGSNGTVTAVLTGASHTFTNLTGGTDYTLYISTQHHVHGFPSAWIPITATTTPTPPNSLNVMTASETSVTLGWGPVAGATSYEVKRGADGAATAASSNASHTFADLTPGTEYTLYLRGRNGDELFAWRSITAKTEPSLEPTNLSVGATRTSLTLSWHGRWSTDGYEVKRGTNGTVTTVSGGPHTFTGLTAGTEYTLYVRAKSGPATEWKSITATTLPAQASGLTATAIGTSITLSWDPTASATGSPFFVGARHYGSGNYGRGIGSTHSAQWHYLQAGTEHTLSARGSSVSVTTPPLQPRSLSATAASTELILSWAAMSGATSYEVKRGAGGTVTTVSSGASHPFSGLTANTEYTLYVRAKNSGGDSGWSSITAKTAPAAPTGLSATATSDSITLSWSAVTGADSYEVKRSPGGETPTTVTGASHRFPDLTAGTAYTLSVRAWNGSGASAWSPLAETTAPAAPAAPSEDDLETTATSDSITLSWPAVTGADSYDVKYSPGGETPTTVTGASHPFPNLTPNTAYTLSVRAKNSGGESGWSSTTARTAPAAPSNPTATATSTSITLSWPAVAGADSYDVKYSPGGETPTTVTRTSHPFPNLTPGTAYTLSVRARNSSGESGWRHISKTTVPAAPNPNAEATSNSITLSWPAVAGATGYDVKYSPGGETPTTITDTSRTFPNLTPGTAYTLSVRARNSSGESSWRHISKTTIPAAPSESDLDAEATSTSITLSWPAVTGATGYDVKYSPGGERPTTVTETSHTFPNLTANTAYTLSVRARNDSGESPWVPLSPTTAPAKPYVAPGPLPLRSGRGPTTAELNWTSSAGATHHEVKQGPDGAVETASGDDWHYFENLVPNVQYTLYVRAANSWGASEWARRTRLGTAPPPAPSDPTVQEESTTTTSLQLSWTAARPSDTTTYEVKLNSGSGGAVTAADRINGHTFSGLTAGAAYTLYVRATDGGRPSAWSPPVTARTALTAPPAP